MALIDNGIIANLSVTNVPAAYIQPEVVEFSDVEFLMQKTLTIAKDDIAVTDNVTTFTNIIAALKTAIDTLIKSDFDTQNKTVSIFTRIIDITTNIHDSEDMYAGDVTEFYCVINTFIKCHS